MEGKAEAPKGGGGSSLFDFFKSLGGPSADAAIRTKTEAEKKRGLATEKQKAAAAAAAAVLSNRKEEGERKKRAAASRAAALRAKPGMTISLDFFAPWAKKPVAPAPDAGAASTKRARAAPARPSKTPAAAPRGVPILTDWKVNLGGSVTGFVEGLRSYEDGTQITTSSIKSGVKKSGNVVVTGSGSKYFLS